MSEEVEIVRRVYDAFSRRDAATVLACYDADIEWDSTGSPLTRLIGGGRVYRGHDGLRAFFREWHEAWEAVEYDCEEVIEAGDRVISVDTMRRRGRASGAEVRLTHAAVWTIRNGRIVRVAWLPTRDDALKAVGLAEDEASSGTSELARRVIGALNRQDLSMLVSCADPDVEWHSFFARLGEGGVYHGHDGARRWMRDLNDAWEIVRAEVDDEIAVGDVAVLTGRIHYRGQGSGIETETPAGWMLRFRDGKVIRPRAFRDPEQALEAVGNG